jgi:hypothetical protein
MQEIIRTSPACNGNGAGSVNGRGLGRRKLTPAQKISLAADLATGQQSLAPSLCQVSALTGVPLWRLSQELKARTRQEVARAQRETEQREAEQRLQAQAEAEALNAEVTAIVMAWDSAAPEAREEAVRVIGVAAVWDTVARVVA